MSSADQIRAQRAAWARNRRRQIAYGRWNPTEQLDVTPVRQHIAALRAYGMSLEVIARLAGETRGAMSEVAYPNHGGALKWITPARAERILAVRFALDDIPSGYRVNAAGTRRRIEALMCMGWSQGCLGRQLGVSRERIRVYRTSARVNSETARAVRDLYDRLWDQPGPEVRARNKAAREGFAPPMAWDDETIDDPCAQPTGMGASSRHLNVEDVEWFLDLEPTATAARVAERFGLKADAVQQCARRAERQDLLDRLARNAEIAGHNVRRSA